jgi:hypothetical protein
MSIVIQDNEECSKSVCQASSLQKIRSHLLIELKEMLFVKASCTSTFFAF